MVQVMNEKGGWLAAFADFEREQGGAAPPWLRRLYKAAIARFDQLGFPGPRNEDWKFTSVAPLARQSWRLPPADGSPTAEAPPGLPSGVLVTSLADAIARHPELVEPHLGHFADYKDLPFTALNTAFLRDGAFVYVPAGVVVDEPIYLRNAVTSAEAPLVWHRRTLVVLGANSRATVVEGFTGPAQTGYFTNAVTELVLGENAVLDHYKVQEEGDEAFHVANTQAVLARAGNFSTHFIGLGGALARNEVRVRFDGEGGEATVNGLYRAAGTQHMDNLTAIDHAMPHCASHELYKGILDGKARGVFNGKIFVRQDAQKTDAKQTNQTLLLSEDATINTKPQLEIYADDVKCTHGATVGNLNAEQLFYLRSRGLNVDAARALLIFAFANDIVGRIKVEALRERLERSLVNLA
jgi:Fe-S cluster assembly protein SufD